MKQDIRKNMRLLIKIAILCAVILVTLVLSLFALCKGMVWMHTVQLEVVPKPSEPILD